MMPRRILLCLLAWTATGLAGSGASLLAQKLANAPSTVMLAKNIRQENANISAAAQPEDRLPSEKSMKQASQAPLAPSIPEQLTLREAEQIAVRNNPHVRVGQLLARAEHEVYRETRSAYMPQVYGGIVGSKAYSGSRFTFDGLRSTRLLTHAGGGVTFDQLIFDFGRTANLIGASKLREKAQNANALASELDVVLITDQAFYSALESQALVKLAQQTVDTRSTTNQQIGELTKNKLRSDVDLAFSEENLAQANLLLLDAQSQYQAALNALTSVLGFDRPMHYVLVNQVTGMPLPPPDQNALVQMALKQRPDLMALNYSQLAAKKFSRAQEEQLLPSVGTTGVVGGTPVRTDQYFTSNWFGAIGLTLKVPIFDGFRYSAEASEAADRARAAQENLRDLRDRVVRDTRNAWLQTNTSYQKISVTEKFLRAANLGLNLAQERYKLGLSSIVELSQAQLAQTQASIENVNARFEYELSLAALNYQIGNVP